MANDGFFSSSQLKTYNKKKPLPPQLNKDFPPEKEPTIKVKNNPSKKNQAILDIECYVNYFLVKFLILSDDSFIEFERTEYQELDYTAIENIIKKYEIITFNGINYDIPILRLALTGATCKELKEGTNSLIVHKMKPWTFEKHHDLPKFKIKHIDIKEIPKGFISLKMYAGRLHCKKMQDLPYPEDSVLTEHQMDMVAEYCGNDCENTKLVMYDLLSQIELRRYMSKKYKIDLMSKSDAQIAEAVFKEEYFNITKKEVEKPEVYSRQFFYQVPDFINFTHPELKKILDVYTNEPVKADSAGNISMNSISGMKVKVGYSTYKIGIGGLHSQEKRAFHVADNDFILSDFDVSSFYPKVILNCGLYPKQMGKVFTQIYEGIVKERLAAKNRVKELKQEIKKLKNMLT